ncbi:hypothetical protein [Gemmata massiliana]|uniref:hypothetical protein n=1 Tax=Gemmata massiliana TaxID=1210884 RepID=UPI0013A6A329|nr:hypothetical protein [Gemmata massiliana]
MRGDELPAEEVNFASEFVDSPTDAVEFVQELLKFRGREVLEHRNSPSQVMKNHTQGTACGP